MSDSSDHSAIREQADRIVARGALGRSATYVRLLEFLVDCAGEGRTPKELEIAAQVFGKGPDFDPSQDSMVRVYAHNLRQKLGQYYSADGRDEPLQIAIPKGEYRVTVVASETQPAEKAPVARAGLTRLRLAAAALVLVAVGAVVGFFIGAGGSADGSAYDAVAASPLWSEVFDDDLPVLVVVGDYYIVGELDEVGNVARLVREFDVNSSEDLDLFAMLEPELGSRYMDLDLTYLARSTAFALRDLLRVIYTSDKPVTVAAMSDLDIEDLRTSHIVYVGYISALDKIIEFVFASSSLEVGDTFDELRNLETGDLYTSEAGLPADYRNYRDYALFSTFPGPNGNQFVVVAGTRDAGLMHSAEAVSDPPYVRSIEQTVPEAIAATPPAFELLYEVTGFDRTNLDAMLVHSARLDFSEIWRGELLEAD